ncbi:Constitutive coactivator of PPAR-gamma-like protein 1 [Merluccius polli]|uniref:Constitutive coactivator of PPAR-gamma-like protein 1 n=1 Tax=Merluccius polli TaxID=89951 RepID=A0AA47MJ58_MERPO|nr:Constitutive coactivator of PPAR-gamma-like protein 1 [Merluccius polli]
MGVHGFQEYIEKHCPNAVVPVELQKLARGSMVTGAGGGAGAGAGGSGGGGGRHRTPQSPLRLLVDAENCLHRLYGGFYTDWVSGGQWNHMLGYLAALARACAGGNIQLLVCFNGALEKGRLHEWAKRQVNERQTAQQIVSHVQGKGTPPPKVWFLPPVCMAHCVRLALLRFRIGVVQSIEDHHLEVIALCRDNGFHGLVAYDSDYALVNMPCYFSAHALKLSRNGKSLTTSQYLMHLVAKRLHLNPSHFIIFASLLGNHILPDEDLAAFHWSLLGPEHPLASLKVRAHQLVLPPCDVVIKAVAEYVRNVPDTSDLDTIAKDIFRHSQSCTADKVLRFRKAVEYYMEASKPTQFPSQTVGPKQTGAPATVPQGCPQKPPHIPQAALIGDSGAQHTLQTLQTEQQAQPLAPAAGGGPPDLSLFGNIPPEGKHTPLYERSSPAAAGPTTAATTVAAENHVDATIAPNTSSSATSSSSPTITSPSSSSSSTITSSTITSSSSENDDSTATTANHVGDHKGGWDKNGNHFVDSPEGELEDKSKVDPPPPPVPCPAPSPPSSGGSSKGSSKGSRLGSDGVPIPSLLSMATRSHMDVLRVAEHRHRKGLMYPYIYHLLTKGEIKMSVTIEDEGNKELPAAVQLFRPVRQYVYGVLFSLAEAKKKAERTAMRRACPPEYSPVMVKEWAAYKGKPPHAPELVEALPFREWTCPNLRKLWLGKAAEDKNRRMRAFLACMRSDTPAMLSPTHVPAHLLVLCCVLRFMLHWPGVRILRRNELDAFLAQALSPKLYEPEQLQDLKIDSLDPRGVQLGALFMTGVDMALFANDACGQPIPWENCCPWMYFDGKLFQSKLIRAGREKAQLIDLCDGQAELAGKVEKMRQSILEGLNFSRPPHPMPFPPPPLPPPPHHHVMPFFPPAGSYYPPPPMMPPPGRARVVSGLQAVSSPGGKLEIAGTVVGQWAWQPQGAGTGGLPHPGGVCSRLRGVISTPVIRAFGRGARYHSLALKSHPTFLGPKHTHVSAPDVKERKKTKPEEEKKKKSDPVEVMGHGGVENGVEDGKSVHVNGEADAILPGSAFSSPDAKACNTTNPYLTNALNLDGGGVVEAVLASEE